MVSEQRVRELALALPEAVERDHHGRPSFRVRDTIFATQWDDRHLNVMLDEPGIRTAVEAHPGACTEVWWGKRLTAVRVDLGAAEEALVEELLADAWERRAPKRALLLRDFGLSAEDAEAWRGSGLSDAAFDDWLIDRIARRPSGSRARETYGAGDVHEFARRAILDALALGPADRLLEIGCGGGLLLRDTVALGASATGIDHSEEMVELARERAPEAQVLLAGADELPFPGGEFTVVAMSVVFLFLPDPAAVLRECRRVMRPGGRLAIYTSSAELRGTPAAPEPLASRAHFHDDDQLVALAREAGFADAAVRRDGGGQLLTASRAA